MTACREVAVVGAGPAGATAAALLARRGLDVLLLERSAFPRDTLCGEFVSPDTAATLEELDLVEPSLLAAAPPLSGFRFTAPGGRELEAELGLPGRGLRRLALDAALAGRARSLGAELREGCRVMRLVPTAGGVSLRLADGTSLNALAVIDASGRSGLAAADASPSQRAESRGFVGFKRHFTAKPMPSGLRRTVEIHAFPGGYAGLNRVETGAVNLCFLARSEALRSAGGPGALLRAGGRANAALGRRLEGLAVLGPAWLSTGGMSFRRPGPGRGPAFETGDAAGMIAPACGDGIGMALRSAELAAEGVVQALGGDATLVLDRYLRRWQKEFRRRLLLGRFLQATLLRPRAAGALIAAGSLLPLLTRWFVRATRDWPRARLHGPGAGPAGA